MRLCLKGMAEPEKQKPRPWRDPQTGWEWQVESPGRMTWPEAIDYAKSLTLAAKRDWRLPALAELETLLDRTRMRSDGRPVIRPEVPFRDERTYWSSTTFEVQTQNAWILRFDGAYILSYPKRNFYAVRCVRG